MLQGTGAGEEGALVVFREPGRQSRLQMPSRWTGACARPGRDRPRRAGAQPPERPGGRAPAENRAPLRLTLSRNGVKTMIRNYPGYKKMQLLCHKSEVGSTWSLLG